MLKISKLVTCKTCQNRKHDGKKTGLLAIERGGKIKLPSCHIWTDSYDFSIAATHEDTQYGPILDSKVFYPRNANKTRGSAAGKPATLPLYLSAPVLTLCVGASLCH